MIIYLVQNRLDNKIYIGQHRGSDPLRRWNQHVWDARNGNASCPIFYNAIRKYGASNFSVTLLSSHADSKQELDLQEIHFIEKYRANERDYGYNVTRGGDAVPVGGMLGKHQSQRQKESARKVGKRNVETGLLARLRTPAHQANAGKLGGKKGGRTRGPILGRQMVNSGFLARIASAGGKKQTHLRWHVNHGIINSNCSLCERKDL